MDPALIATKLDPACKPRRLDCVISYSVEDEIVLYAPDRGQAVSLNRSAGAIWNLCGGDNSLEDITNLLAEWAGCPVADILEDVQLATANLLENGLIELPSPKG